MTDDYGYLNIDKPFRGIDEGTKRKIVYPDDLLKYHQTWDKKLVSALKLFSKVAQPLHQLITDELKEKLLYIEKGEQEMDSILTNYYSKE